MRRRTLCYAALATAVLVLGSFPAGTAASTTPMKFGMNVGSMDALIGMGIKPDYAQYWAGVWNEKSGWSYLGSYADKAADAGVIPVVEWWYWGDDISKGCVTNGCHSKLHDAWKSRAKWREGAIKLADTLHGALKGRPGIVVLETEFNKGDIQGWETFDGYLAEHARIFRERAPELKLALGFGNWNSGAWGTFDRAVGAVDMTGIQLLRGSTRDSSAKYLDAVDTIKSAAAKLKGTFGKPMLLHDLALSSYPEPTWAGHQEKVVKELFSRMGELKGAGLSGIIWRDLKDNPKTNLANYYGQAERWWGLQHADGSSKPALNDWVAGVKAERGAPGSGGSTPPPPGTGSATFEPKGTTNNWWVEVKVSGFGTVTGVDARVNGGSWQGLEKKSWGAWAKSIHVADGSKVEFRARNSAGATATSGTYTWGSGTTSGGSATFEPKGTTNHWWVEVKVSGFGTVTGVDARLDGGSWKALEKKSWGAWAKSIHVADGSKVEFRARNSAGATATSKAYAWG